MALTVTFGNGGSAKTTSLVADKDQFQTLNGPAVGSQNAGGNNVGQVVDGSSQTVQKASVAGTGTGGVVDVGFTDNTFSFDVSTAWNTVKNAYATSNTGEKVVFTDFVQVDVDFHTATTDSSVAINDVKRANVETGSGNDTVSIKLASNGGSWQDVVSVKTGAGNDSITIGKGSVSDSAKIVDGSLTHVDIDAGAGNDTIDLSGVKLLSSTIIGGTGNDTVTLSSGADKVIYTAGENLTLNGYNANQDTLDLGGKVAGLDYDVHVARNGDVVYEFNDGKITFHNGSPLAA